MKITDVKVSRYGRQREVEGVRVGVEIQTVEVQTDEGVSAWASSPPATAASARQPTSSPG